MSWREKSGFYEPSLVAYEIKSKLHALGTGGGGGTLIFYTYIGWYHFWGFKILNSNIYFFFLGGGSEK